MKKLESSIKNMAIVLTAIAVIAGGLLAYVNSATAPQIEKINAENLAAGIKKVIGNEKLTVTKVDTIYKEGAAEKTAKDIEFITYTAADETGAPIGVAISTSENGFGGALQVLAGFDNEGKVLGYTILASSETPGLGAKAGDWFQKGAKGDIIGKNPGKDIFEVSKDKAGGIDAITASTITSRAFLKAVKKAYDKHFGSGVNTTSGATKQADGSEAESAGTEQAELSND